MAEDRRYPSPETRTTGPRFTSSTFFALTGLVGQPLRAPVERAQQLPDMPIVVAHPEAVADQPRHSRTGPQRSRKSMRFGAFEQQGFQLRELLLA